MRYYLSVYDGEQLLPVGRGILRATLTGVFGTIFIHGQAVECELLMAATGMNAEEFLQKLQADLAAARQALSSSLIAADKLTE